jgi:hypothetical protein
MSAVARLLNAPGFLAAWFSPFGGYLQFAVMLAVNWVCWSVLCVVIYALLAALAHVRNPVLPDVSDATGDSEDRAE